MPSHSFFDVTFWQQLVATLIGVMIGVPIALWVNRLQERREARGREEVTRRRKEQLVIALTTEVTFGQTLAAEMLDALSKPGKIVVGELDTAVLDATASLKYELLDVPLCDALDKLRYYMKGANRFVDQQLRLFHDPATKTTEIVRTGQPTVTMYDEMMPAVQSRLRDALTKVREQVGIAMRLFPRSEEAEGTAPIGRKGAN